MVISIAQICVAVVGVAIVAGAGWGLANPDKLTMAVKSIMDQRWGMSFAVAVRLVLGAALIIAAPASPFPIVFQVLGAIVLLAAVALVLMGRERVSGFINWLFERISAASIRLMLVFGIAFGGFLIYGVV